MLPRLDLSALSKGREATNGEVLTPGDVHGITERLGLKTECARIRVEDRMTEDADWY